MAEELNGAPAEVVETTTAIETPAPVESAAPVENAAPAEPTTRRETLEKAMKAAKDGTLRGQHAARQPREQGKFAPGTPAPEVKPITEPKARPALLKSLKRELEPHWNNAPQELVEAFAEREAAFERGAAQWQPKAQMADAILEQFKPYEWILKAEGATPQTAIAPLLQTAALLRTGTPQQKAQSVAQMIQQFNIPLDHLQAYLGGQQPAADPNSHLVQEVNNLKQMLFQTTQQQEQVQNQRAMTVIQQFASDPKNAHFEAVRDKMTVLLQAPDVLMQLTGQDINYMSERERLQLAYDTALRSDPSISQQVLAQQQADSQRQVRERAQAAVHTARQAAVQVTGAPGSPLASSVNPTDRRSLIANALRAAQV